MDPNHTGQRLPPGGAEATQAFVPNAETAPDFSAAPAAAPAPATAAELIELLREGDFLKPVHFEKLARDLQHRFPAPADLAGELVRWGWITRFQADLLLQGRARELKLGPYQLLEPLGQGGMGRVFKARHQVMKRVVALKVIRNDWVSNPDAIGRFHREVEVAAQLSHPNIVAAYDAAQADGVHFLAMEFVEGKDLGQLLQEQGRLAPAAACEFARQAALGLQHAYERGLVHRDIKPSNLMVALAPADGSPDQGLRPARPGQVKILDLGLARSLNTGDDRGQVVTRFGTVMGTPDYMSPEQATDLRRADIRSDLYSLGCTLYHLLAGKKPFPTESVDDKIQGHLHQEPRRLEELCPGLPAGLGDVVRKMMAKKPEARYQMPRDAAAALAPFCGPAAALPPMPPGPAGDAATVLPVNTVAQISAPATGDAAPAAPPRRRWGLWAAAGAAALVVVLALVLLQSDPPPPVEESFVNSVGMRLTLIHPGYFVMGSPVTEKDRQADEGPAHEVEITRPYYLGVHEVTEEQFQRVFPGRRKIVHGLVHPVVGLTWEEGAEFCRQLTEQEKGTGRTYRLPTEAEWEYACRAGTQTVYSFGNDPADMARYGWVKADAAGKPRPVGQLLPNAWGLYDMHGNAFELCQDYYDAAYYKDSPAQDPAGPSRSNPPSKKFGEHRATRGGDCAHGPELTRSAARNHAGEQERYATFGLRVVCETPELAHWKEAASPE